MSSRVTHLFVGAAVTDFAAASEWYERLFGRPADMLPEEREAVWRLTSNGSIYVKTDPERAGTARLAIAVSDLDTHVSELGEREIAIDRTQPGPPPRAIVRDADGNEIMFFQDRA
jgi:hypothetical protein